MNNERTLIPEHEFAAKIATEQHKDRVSLYLTGKPRRIIDVESATIYEVDFDKVRKWREQKHGK